MEREAQMRQYLTQKINPLFEKLFIDLLVDMPDNYVDIIYYSNKIKFCINWLQAKESQFQPILPDIVQQQVNDKKDNIQDQKQIILNDKKDKKDKKDKQDKQDKQDKKDKKKIKKKKKSDDEDSEDDDFNENDMILQASKRKISAYNQIVKAMQNRKQRCSVSAESYGTFNKKQDFKPRVIPKSEEAKNRIRSKMDQAFMFSVLDDKEKNIVIMAMEEKIFHSGDWVIKQGEQGDILYVVDSGNLDCFKKFSKDAQDTYLKTYQPGEAFGELALLYNAPRAASIQAKTECILWALDRECFNVIVKDATRKKREKYESVMEKVKILEELDPYEKSRLGDGVLDIKFSKGEYVITQGQKADKFYIVAEGTLKATKSEKQGQECAIYNQGDYFGEVGLVHDIPRQANVIAQTDVTLVYLDKEKFNRLLLPSSHIFKSKEKARYGKAF